MAGKTIIHRAGEIDGILGTNSLEAFCHTLATGERVIELDCVKLVDGFGIAHDETESKLFGKTETFSRISTYEFERSRIYERYNPITFGFLSNIVKIIPDVRIVIDSKCTAEQFSVFLMFLMLNYEELADKLYFQCYNDSWLTICEKFGRKNVIVALWKHFGKDPTGDTAYQFAKRACEKFDVLGITIRWTIPGTDIENRKSETIGRFHALRDVYFHNQEISLYEEKTLTAEGFNFFTGYSLGSLPNGFIPERYRAIHEDLRSMSDLQAACHYILHGRKEERQFK